MSQSRSALMIRALMISALISSAQQCHPVPTSATQQLRPAVLPISVHHCSIISASSSMPTSATSSVPIGPAYQCSLISSHQ
ncbi:unnamed protein product [Staurois parvus]|uniref:Secreted protein n=1 Tax=Staurois parvus TaxID=386267 RepID=A0ABN9G752_9NEOB|nr:unnamed protein product [Staurois parvus]